MSFEYVIYFIEETHVIFNGTSSNLVTIFVDIVTWIWSPILTVKVHEMGSTV